MDLDLVCANCRATLDGSFNGRHEFEVILCPDCEEEMKKESYDEGYAARESEEE